MGGIYQEFLLALHDVRIRRMFALAVAAAICLAGWTSVWFVPNRYQAEARIFVQVDNLLPDKIGVSIASRQRQIGQLKRTLTSTVTIERLIRDPEIAVFMPKNQRPIDVIIDLRRTVEVVEQQENLFRISAPIWLRGRSTLQSIATHGAMAYARAVSMLVPEERRRLFTADFLASLQGYRAEDRYISVMSNAPAQTMLDRIQYADLKISLPGGILTKVDRTTMAYGLEVRSPFLDTELVDVATQLPDALRLHAGQGKWILKMAMQGLLPKAVCQRPKLGFVPPLLAWFRGPLAEIALSLRHAPFVTETGWFHAAWIEEIAHAHITGKADWSRALWQLWIFS